MGKVYFESIYVNVKTLNGLRTIIILDHVQRKSTCVMCPMEATVQVINFDSRCDNFGAPGLIFFRTGQQGVVHFVNQWARAVGCRDRVHIPVAHILTRDLKPTTYVRGGFAHHQHTSSLTQST